MLEKWITDGTFWSGRACGMRVVLRYAGVPVEGVLQRVRGVGGAGRARPNQVTTGICFLDSTVQQFLFRRLFHRQPGGSLLPLLTLLAAPIASHAQTATLFGRP